MAGRSILPATYLKRDNQAYVINVHVVAAPLYGGMRLFFAIGAVVDPFAGFHTPDSGQISPVRAIVPNGLVTLFTFHHKPPHHCAWLTA